MLDLTTLGRGDAERLLAAAPDGRPPCVRVWRRADGRVWLGRLQTGVVAGVLAATAACTPHLAPLDPTSVPASASQRERSLPVPSGEVWVEVVDAEGLGLPGFLFTFASAAGAEAQAVELDADGKAILRAVAPGEHAWRILGQGLRTTSGVIKVPPDRGLAVQITVEFDELELALGGITVAHVALDRADHGHTWSAAETRRLPR